MDAYEIRGLSWMRKDHYRKAQVRECWTRTDAGLRGSLVAIVKEKDLTPVCP